jgi:hypothetical protein
VSSNRLTIPNLFVGEFFLVQLLLQAKNMAAAWRCITSISINSLRRSAKIIASRILLMRVSSIRSRAKSCAQVAPVPRTVLRSWVLVTLAQTLHRQTTPFP